MCKRLRLQLVAERWPSTHETWVLTLVCQINKKINTKMREKITVLNYYNTNRSGKSYILLLMVLYLWFWV